MSIKGEDYLASIGISDPIKAGREWAEAIWGVDGVPLSAYRQSLHAMLAVIRANLETMPAYVPAFYVTAHLRAFESAAKARLFDLHIAAQHMGPGSAWPAAESLGAMACPWRLPIDWQASEPLRLTFPFWPI